MSDSQIIEDQFNEAYNVAAQIVRDYGIKYLPLFKRMHEEKEAMQAKQDLLSIALQASLEKL